MRGALGPNSVREGRAGKNVYLLFSTGPAVDVLCSWEQHRMINNMIVDYNGGALGPNSVVEGRVAENLYLLFSAGPSVDVLCSRSAPPSPISETKVNPLS